MNRTEKKIGVLYWITGLSGAGKTTLGNQLYYKLKEYQENVVLLDGDVLKNIISDKCDYSLEDRSSRAMKYARICKMLTDQGMVVICCTIAMFDAVREWNRKNNRAYVEVFLDVPLDILRERDQKGLYSGYENAIVHNLAGCDVEVEFPKNPDITIVNDGRISIEKCVQEILDYQIRYLQDFDRDVEYWNLYYASQPDINKPSLFAVEAFKRMQQGKSVLELGCGNGRDSIFFAQNGLNVIGIDASDKAIRDLKRNYIEKGDLPIQFVCDDFVCSTVLFQTSYDYCYSRFSLHAITENQELTILQNIYNSLNPGGLFFIEVRSINDDIFGKGDAIARNSFVYNGHFRRFIVMEELIGHLKDVGFYIDYAVEKRGFAPFENSDPPIIRVIAKKQK